MILFAAGAASAVVIIKEQPQVLGLSTSSELTNLTSQIGKLIILPNDEMPTLTTINDVDKLKDQPFFANAKNNDKLLVYTNAKWAVLYRPSENRIINAGAYDIRPQTPIPVATIVPTITPSPTPVATPTATPTISPSPSATPSASPVATPKP